MKLIAEFEVESASTEAIPGESKFARLRRIATKNCRPIKRVTTILVPKDECCGVCRGAISMREASDLMLAQMM